jgi:methyl-accepting chemotaxis protein
VLADIEDMQQRFAKASVRLQSDHGIDRGNDAIRQGLSEALGLIQFQDVLRQRVGHVQLAVTRLNDHLQGAAEQLLHPEAGTRQSLPLSLRDVLAEQAGDYVMNSQRQTHQAVTGQPPAAQRDERPAIELF